MLPLVAPSVRRMRCKADKAGVVWVVSFDFVEETMEYVQDGVILATIGQDPFAQGHDPAIRLFNMIVGGVSPNVGAWLPGPML